MKKTNKAKTSWGGVADWYNKMLQKSTGTYQQEVILPNLLKRLNLKKNEVVLDLACGQGFFTRQFFEKEAKVMGVDISKELIAIAKKTHPQEIKFFATPADRLDFISPGSVDKITSILAIQNIDNVGAVFQACSRVLKPQGKLFLVLNHPCFRVPKQSGWEWDAKNKIQFRRINQYLSESRVKIQMHPGDEPELVTLSFHRPLQFYFQNLNKNNFNVSWLEEWVTHRKTTPGPRALAEDRAKAEIPLFLLLEAGH